MLALSILLSPFIGKGLENTTKALLPGLSTTEQIETVADVVDTNKIEAENKIAEQQAVIEDQQAKLSEQQTTIETQQSELKSASTQIKSASAELVQQSNCDKVRDAYHNIPSVKSDAKRPYGTYNNIVELYKTEKEFLDGGNFADPEVAKKIENDFDDISDEYKEFKSLKPLCPKF